MTVQEFSLEFDLMYNNIMSNQAPGLSEYEKSLFLTQAQEALVLDIYSGKLGSPFESTEEVTDYLSPLVKQVTLKTDVYGCGLDSRSVFFEIPEDVWFKTGKNQRAKKKPQHTLAHTAEKASVNQHQGKN